MSAEYTAKFRCFQAKATLKVTWNDRMKESVLEGSRSLSQNQPTHNVGRLSQLRQTRENTCARTGEVMR